MRAAGIAILFVFLSPHAHALEPVTALEDGFAVPSGATMVEANVSYPGAETHAGGVFAAGAWSVPYGVGELAVTTGLAGFCAGRFGFSLVYSGSGFDLYGDEQEKLGFAVRLGGGVSAGLRVTRYAMRIKGFGHASAWSSDAGFVFHPHESLYLACSCEDLASAEIGETREPLDGRLRLAASYRMREGVTVLASLSKVRMFGPSLSFGMLFEVADVLAVGVTAAGEPDRFEFLCRVGRRAAEFSYRGSYHRELGMSEGFSVGWRRGRNAGRGR